MMDKYSPNAMQSSKHYFSLYPEPKIALSLSLLTEIYIDVSDFMHKYCVIQLHTPNEYLPKIVPRKKMKLKHKKTDENTHEK